MSEDFYEVLGVSRDASEDEIKRAYRKKAAEYHPDVSDDPDAEEKFKQIKRAKEVLTDDEKRKAYDRLGHDRFEEAEKRGGATGPGGAGGVGDFGAASGFGGGGFDDLFEQFFGGGRQDGSRPRQGRDLKTRMRIDLEEAFEGATKEVTVTRPDRCSNCEGSGYPPDAEIRTCPQCNGRGQVSRVQQTPFGRVEQRETCRRCGGDGEIADGTCRTCGGDGIVEEEATLEVDIPAGIRDGQSLRVEGEGAPGESGGPKGDLLIEVAIRSHEEFERDGDDLHYDLPISFPQAVFGASVEVPTLDGPVEFEIPEGTQSGETFRLQGKGMPKLRGRGNGDLYVTVQVVTPESLNKEQREALKAFAEAGGEEVEVSEGFFDRIKSTF